MRMCMSVHERGYVCSSMRASAQMQAWGVMRKGLHMSSFMDPLLVSDMLTVNPCVRVHLCTHCIIGCMARPALRRHSKQLPMPERQRVTWHRSTVHWHRGLEKWSSAL